MFCSKCGARIADNAKFCPYCSSQNEFFNPCVDAGTPQQNNQSGIATLKNEPKLKASVGMNAGLAITLCILASFLSIISDFLDDFGDDPIHGSIVFLFSAIVSFIIWICATNLLRKKGNTPKKVLTLSIITAASCILESILLILSDILYSDSFDAISLIFYISFLGVAVWWAICLMNSFAGKLRTYAIFTLVSVPIYLALVFSGNPELHCIMASVLEVADCILLIMALTETNHK